MKSTIWADDDYLKLAPINDELIKKAEEVLNVKLPESYINLLKEQNGGTLLLDTHPTSKPNSWADDHVNVSGLYGISFDENESSILESRYLIREWEMPENIVLLSGDGHTWIALDYRNVAENPPVIFIDNEFEEIIELAPNFESFLQNLTTYEYDEE
ncbi:SMI1/KNR4 family protein [Bacillus thuringiensis]|uniref:SMI1/KNR4 family protein n=1 Tax=Bacillus thuringiensis TaxID=1428 RepID=A0ABD6R652_BACTU|nr:SMI1/KNR4 family protein [Bacillus thuringiensis]HDR4482338.1 SMI1/KNR4 family protein [Bacillus cereus]MED2983668.1 SMI1/KNR4 family protein [Bacillus thuringiensis]MED3445588.1 SMI1/KNR4 family protein [Bacillus thuringiensis]MRB60709.1 SMI1/KNR4 family protein [Bacillus thuringiensis]OPD49753.1 SMI1/KNR4 family protein [Bacillus thuringiensis]